VFGVAAEDSAVLGCAKAGASTFSGFAALQTVQNLGTAGGKNWLDADFGKA
jgi:hypothetical protein